VFRKVIYYAGFKLLQIVYSELVYGAVYATPYVKTSAVKSGDLEGQEIDAFLPIHPTVIMG
jgi:hypothetical protein